MIHSTTDDRSEREKHLEELYEVMKNHCAVLEEKVKLLEKKIETLIQGGFFQKPGG